MAFDWTDEQKKVIELRDRSILVSAAAGSGKTAVLVQRILGKILDRNHPVDIDRMLIMTFTRAAAAEMKERIFRALENALFEDPDNEHLQKQMVLIHASHITTIDGFCAWLIKSYFHMIDLDPGYRMLDEGEEKLLREDTVLELLEDAYEKGTEEFTEFVDYFCRDKSDDGLSALLQKLYDMAVACPDPEGWLSSCAENYSASSLEEFSTLPMIGDILEEAREILLQARENLLQAIAICQSPEGPEQYVDTFTDDLETVQELLSCTEKGFDVTTEAFSFLSWGRLPGRGKKDVDPVKKEQAKNLRDEAKDMVNALQKEVFFGTLSDHFRLYRMTQRPVRTLLNLVLEYKNLYTEKKREKDVLDFNDLEHLSLQILQKETPEGTVPSEAARELSLRFDEVMVDEYQDSNLLQEEIAKLVSGWADGRENTFMVGDVKQSIYRFRLARPDLFMKKYGRFSYEDGPEQKIDLHKNFRSRTQVLDLVNYLFRALMGEDLGGITYGDTEALYPGAEYPESAADDNTTEVLIAVPDAQGSQTKLFSEDEDPEEDSDGPVDPAEKNARELEALMTAHRIRELKESFQVYDRAKDCMRPVCYGDMVILLRSLTGWAETFRDALSSQGIPVYVSSRTGYFQAVEVQTILNYLRILDNPRQDIPLQGVMMSPIGNMNGTDLAVIRSLYPDGNLWDSVQAFLAALPIEPVQDTYQKVSRFVNQLRHHREMVPGTSVHLLIRTILTETGYDLVSEALPDGERRMANLSMLCEKAREYEHTSYRGLFNFVRYIEKLQKFEVDFGEANVNGAGPDAVQIMTIHKSKGLEFPVVFVSGTGKAFNRMDENAAVLAHEEYGVGVQAFSIENRTVAETLMRRRVRRCIRMDSMGEELRILYVALTRAKEKLIITGFLKDPDKKAASLRALVTREEALLPFYTRYSARSFLDLILAGLSAHRDMEGFLADQGVFSHGKGQLRSDAAEYKMCVQSGTEIASGVLLHAMEEQADEKLLREWDPDKVVDPELRKTIEERFSYQYPYDALAGIPVKVSVSELKKRSWGEEEEETEILSLPASGAPLLYDQSEAETKEGVSLPAPDAPLVHDQSEAEAKDSVALPDPDAPLLRPRFMTGDQEEVMTGASRGTAYHRVMECLDYHQTDTDSDLQDQITLLVAQQKLTEEEAACVRVRDIRRFLETDLGQRMKKAALSNRLLREQPFMMQMPARELDPAWDADTTVLVQGIIDACFLEEDDFILVDYKTDRAAPGQESLLIDRYRVQLEDYTRALTRLTHRTVKETYIYSFALGRAVILEK